MAGRREAKIPREVRAGGGGAAGAGDDLRAELQAAKREVDQLRKILARVDHEEMLKRIPEPVASYSDDLPGRIVALAAVGLFGAEIRAELGVNAEQWKEWLQISAFAAAVARARDLSLAYWHKIAREAVQSKDWKMPLGNLLKMVDDLQADDMQQARGDASMLVVYSPGAVQ